MWEPGLYLETVNSAIESEPLSIKELKDVFFSLRIKKSPGYDEISFNVVKECFGELYDPSIFELSLEKRIFLMTWKLLELLLFTKLVTVLNWETMDQYQCFHAFQNS